MSFTNTCHQIAQQLNNLACNVSCTSDVTFSGYLIGSYGLLTWTLSLFVPATYTSDPRSSAMKSKKDVRVSLWKNGHTIVQLHTVRVRRKWEPKTVVTRVISDERFYWRDLRRGCFENWKQCLICSHFIGVLFMQKKD